MMVLLASAMLVRLVGPTDMYYLLDTVPPIRIECENVATV